MYKRQGVNDAEGKVVLSRKKLVAMESWNKIKEAYESGETLEGKIIKAVKGGVIALTDGSQVFIPARQASGRFVQDLQSLVGTCLLYTSKVTYNQWRCRKGRKDV